MGKYLVTYDVSIQKTRDQLHSNFTQIENICLSETCFLISCDEKILLTLYQGLEYTKDDKFVVIDIVIWRNIEHGIDKVEFNKNVNDFLFMTFKEFVQRQRLLENFSERS